MTDDPIVEEVHQTRAKLLAEHGGNLDQYLEAMRKRTAEYLTEAPVKSPEELKRKLMKRAS